MEEGCFDLKIRAAFNFHQPYEILPSDRLGRFVVGSAVVVGVARCG
jgi:hypothetical protein